MEVGNYVFRFFDTFNLIFQGKDRNGLTVLHVAVAEEVSQTLQMLLSRLTRIFNILIVIFVSTQMQEARHRGGCGEVCQQLQQRQADSHAHCLREELL